MKLSCEELAKTFPGREGEVAALDGVDLEIGDGEFPSIVGPNGCSKSTLFKQRPLVPLREASGGQLEEAA
jgi:NitT/TauT family transport system ATP-binding protein